MGGAWIKSCVVVFAVLRLSRSFSNTLRRAWHFWLTFGACDRVTFEPGFCYINPGGAHVVVQPHGSGGFGVVSVQLKVWALHVKWVRCFVTSFSCCMQFLFSYCRKAFGSLPGVLFSRRYHYDLSSLPPFHRGLLSAWVAAEGSFSATRESLVVGSFSCESREQFRCCCLTTVLWTTVMDEGSVPLGWSGSGSVIWDHSDHGRSKLIWTNESTPDKYSTVHLIYHDPSDLGSEQHNKQRSLFFFLKNVLALPFQRHVFLLSAKPGPKLHNKAVSNLGAFPKIFAWI